MSKIQEPPPGSVLVVSDDLSYDASKRTLNNTINVHNFNDFEVVVRVQTNPKGVRKDRKPGSTLWETVFPQPVFELVRIPPRSDAVVQFRLEVPTSFRKETHVFGSYVDIWWEPKRYELLGFTQISEPSGARSPRGNATPLPPPFAPIPFPPLPPYTWTTPSPTWHPPLNPLPEPPEPEVPDDEAYRPGAEGYHVPRRARRARRGEKFSRAAPPPDSSHWISSHICPSDTVVVEKPESRQVVLLQAPYPQRLFDTFGPDASFWFVFDKISASSDDIKFNLLNPGLHEPFRLSPMDRTHLCVAEVIVNQSAGRHIEYSVILRQSTMGMPRNTFFCINQTLRLRLQNEESLESTTNIRELSQPAQQSTHAKTFLEVTAEEGRVASQHDQD